MKKGTFYKLIGNGSEKRVIKYNGYIDDENQIAYAKKTISIYGKEHVVEGWEATDIKIGAKFAEGRTRKECIENSIKALTAINKARNDISNMDYKGMEKVLIFLISYGKWANDKLIQRKVNIETT